MSPNVPQRRDYGATAAIKFGSMLLRRWRLFPAPVVAALPETELLSWATGCMG